MVEVCVQSGGADESRLTAKEETHEAFTFGGYGNGVVGNDSGGEHNAGDC